MTDNPNIKINKVRKVIESEEGGPLTLAEMERNIAKMAAFLDSEKMRRMVVVYCIAPDETAALVEASNMGQADPEKACASWVGVQDVNGPGFMKGMAYAVADGALTFDMSIAEMCARLVSEACSIYSTLLDAAPEEVKKRVRAEISQPLIIQIGGPEMPPIIPTAHRNIMEQ